MHGMHFDAWNAFRCMECIQAHQNAQATLGMTLYNLDYSKSDSLVMKAGCYLPGSDGHLHN